MTAVPGVVLEHDFVDTPEDSGFSFSNFLTADPLFVQVQALGEFTAFHTSRFPSISKGWNNCFPSTSKGGITALHPHLRVELRLSIHLKRVE